MPPVKKRASSKTRALNEEAKDKRAPDIDMADSSPSRPVKRRKKDNDSNDTSIASMTTALPLDRAGIDLNDESLVAVVVPHLTLPSHQVQVVTEHANAIHEKQNKDGVKAFAKLAGKDWTFYIKTLKNKIGRPPEGMQAVPRAGPDDDEAADPTAEDDRVHVDLGPNKMVSRSHAEINFDPETEGWNLKVNGRNGVRVDEIALRKGDEQRLISGQVIEIGGVEMIFVLPEPTGNLHIQNRYLHRAGLIHMSEEQLRPHNLASPMSSDLPLNGQRWQNYSGKPPSYLNGAMLLTADDVDLALESNGHIKPSYSYAQMISQAILDAPDERLNLNGIYQYIMTKYAYYRKQQGGGWQNSIRHNLSLNKAFHKVARSTDEPGKGMKWCIVPEVRDEMARNCIRGGRGGHRGSSQPTSPAAYSNRPLKDSTGEITTPFPNDSPSLMSPATNAFPAIGGPHYTPDRNDQLSNTRNDSKTGDGSPLPRHRKAQIDTLSTQDGLPRSPTVVGGPYFQEEPRSLITPAPSRIQPRLAPPSTAQRPSQHMPTSSPAPFWKYADLGTTPMKIPAYGSSPTKNGGDDLPPVPQSSSPPRPAVNSPSRNGTTAKPAAVAAPDLELEEQGFDLTRGFQSIGSFHGAGPSRAIPPVVRMQ